MMGAKKALRLIPFGLAFVAILTSYSCGSSGPTSPKPPVKEVFYTLQIQYIRTSLNPDWARSYPYIILETGSPPVHWDLTEIKDDDMHFHGDAYDVPPRADFWIACMDFARYDGSEESSCLVGDILIVTVKETGVVKELKDIRAFPDPNWTYNGPLAKAAFFRLTEEGTIISDPPL